MSSADTRPSRSSRGFTLLELVIAIGILAMMALVIERTLASTGDTDRYLQAIERSQGRAEKAIYRAYREVSGARRLFTRDPEGQGYLDALDLSRFPLASGARLPLPDATRPLGPDVAGDPRTGNVLFFVRESDPVVCTADADAGVRRYVDIYHFVCCYPHQTDRRLITTDEQRALDFVVWSSIGYPSWPQIQDIADPDQRQNVVLSLYETYGYEIAWDPTGDVDTSFYRLHASGAIDGVPIPAPTITEHPGLSEGPMLVHGDAQLARTIGDSPYERAIFTRTEGDGWVPNGFEVKITGISGYRKVWMHIVVVSQSGRNRVAVHPSTLIASVRDL